MAESKAGRIGVSSKTNSVDMCYSNVSGIEILKNPKYCKGLAFSIEERQIIGKIYKSWVHGIMGRLIQPNKNSSQSPKIRLSFR